MSQAVENLTKKSTTQQLASDPPCDARRRRPRRGTAITCSLLLASLALATTSAAAESRSESTERSPGVEFGLRAGLGLFFYGTEFDRDSIDGMFPFWLDAGYRFSPLIYVGAFAQAGPLVLNNRPEGTCFGTTPCRGWNYRIGLDAIVHLLPESTAVDPWAGIGIGYEFYAVSGWEKGHGPEFVNLQLGVSFPVARHVTAGPFLAVAIGRYTQVTRERAGQVYDDKPVHDWLILGLAAAYGP